MQKYLKIETKVDDKDEIIHLAGTYFDVLKIDFDSPDDTEKKMDRIENLIIIEGKLDTGCRKLSSDFAKWALLPSTKPGAYRNLTLWIVGDNNMIYRKMEYSKCFIVDYRENIGKEDKFELKLKQKTDCLHEIKISSDELEFNPKDHGFLGE
jgi:hypothetical protein